LYVTHTNDFGEKIVAKLLDYNRILKFVYSPRVDDLHCASQNWRKKNPLKAPLCNYSNNNNNNNNKKLWCAIIKG
jgi:hypothetical protein